MKRTLYLFALIILLGGISSTSVAKARSLTSDDTSTSNSSDDSDDSEDSVDPAETEDVNDDSVAESSNTKDSDKSKRDSKSKRDERIEEAKAKFAIKLTEAQKARLSLKCVGAQGRIKLRSEIASKASETRGSVYSNVVTRLKELSEKLKSSGADTTLLNTQLTELETKIATLKTSETNFKQALADLQEMDCKSDTESFKAALELARDYHKTLLSNAQLVRSYLKDTIKPTLQTLKQSSTDSN